MTSVLWLRRDLRRHDLPALNRAAENPPVHVVFVIDPALWSDRVTARQAWLAATLPATDAAYGGKLHLLAGDPRDVVPRLAAQVRAGSVHVSRETSPYGRRRDAAMRELLHDSRIDWVETGTPYAVDPGTVHNSTGKPYQVFTPFAKAWRTHGAPPPTDDVRSRIASPAGPATERRGLWKRVELREQQPGGATTVR